MRCNLPYRRERKTNQTPTNKQKANQPSINTLKANQNLINKLKANQNSNQQIKLKSKIKSIFKSKSHQEDIMSKIVRIEVMCPNHEKDVIVKLKDSKEVKLNNQRIYFTIVVLISFLAIYIYNLLTPLMSDDLLFDRSLYSSIGDIFREEYNQYLSWNGRSVLQIILKICSLMPLILFQLCNSLCFVICSLLIYCNINPKNKYDSVLYLLIQLCIWNFSVDFSQTVLWLSGACNYLWGITIILGFITLYRYLMGNAKKIKHIKVTTIGMFVYGILAGWGNENTSGGAILIILMFSAMYFYENHKLEKWMDSGIFGMIIGFLFLLLAPGNQVRGEIMKAEETYTGIYAFISRGLKVIKAMDKYLFIYMAVIIVLGTYFYYQKYKAEQLKEVFIFAIAALATAGVLILTPEPMPRAYFGANIYMMIAALQMIQGIREKDTFMISLKIGAIMAASIAMIFVYIEEGANLARILREVKERETYIEEQVELGKRELTLPMLRPQFKSKYSYMYDSDISKDEDWWMNEVYCIAYGLEKIDVVERETWTEY